jgi:ABC-type transport system involved in Fe-S cluster assembly fused permease/ATPase subunit
MSSKPDKPVKKISADKTSLTVTLIHLWPYLWPTGRRDLQMRLFWCLLLIIVSKLALLTVPYAFKWATDALVVVSGGKVELRHVPPFAILGIPLVATLLYGAMRILQALLTQLRDAVFAKVMMHAVRRLSYMTFEHMHRLSLRFHLEKRMGGLSRILERGRTGIEDLSQMAMLTLFPTILEFALVLGVLTLQFNWRYSLISGVMVVIYLAYTVIATNWRIKIRRQMNDSEIESNAKAVDSLLNYETVKYFNAEEREAKRYDESTAVYEKASVKSYTSLAVLNAGQATIFTLGMTFSMALCVQDIMTGRATIGDFVLINALLMQLYMPLNFMGTVYRQIKQAIVDIEKMFGVLQTPPEVPDRPGALPLIVRQGIIGFDNVRFHYDPARPILKNISFEVPAGKTIAIVGPSGAGKSTISRILFRFYDISGGSVTIDGQDIRDVTQDSLRRAIGMVPQDTVLFNDTIRYNIAYGCGGCTQAEVENAARMAQIDSFIKTLPQGYDSMVGERGLKLSGGEKQRVAIARTILKNPPILILDEATSALDSHTEREIQIALDAVSQNRTTLVIAHRLSTVIKADQIIVLEQGQIIERGTHLELLGKNGLYASLWNRQREAEIAEETLERTRAEGLVKPHAAA